MTDDIEKRLSRLERIVAGIVDEERRSSLRMVSKLLANEKHHDDTVQGTGREELWTIRARPDLIEAVKTLAEELSRPRAKVSVAALMEEAMELLLAKYERRTSRVA